MYACVDQVKGMLKNDAGCGTELEGWRNRESGDTVTSG